MGGTAGRLGHCLICPTTLTKALNFDHLSNGSESQHGGLFSNESVYIGIIEFCNGATLTTDQELPRMRTARITASDEGIQGIQAMHQIRLDQKFEGSVYSWRCGSSSFPIEAIENLIGTCWLVTAPDELENPPAQPGQAQVSCLADQFGAFECRLDTVIVVVMRWREVDCGGRTIHMVQLSSVPQIVHDAVLPIRDIHEVSANRAHRRISHAPPPCPPCPLWKPQCPGPEEVTPEHAQNSWMSRDGVPEFVDVP